MLDFLFQYSLFFAKTATVAISVLIVVIGILAFSAKQKGQLKKGKLEITNLSEKIKETEQEFKHAIYSKKHIKSLEKAEKQKLKEAKKNKTDKNAKDNEDNKPKLFIIEFNGDIKASAVTTLQHCLNAILPIADKKHDEILVKIESGGGMVHSYGFAASQLDRIRQHGIKLTVTIDKIAASGGYMMACVADQIISAPFAIVGSIGVLGQLPNFNKLLENHNIEFEQHTAGEYKRTLTMLGKNDEKARSKFKQELNETHELFKDHIKSYRPDLNIHEIATGEHWYGQIALQKKLVDKIATTDDVILDYYKTHDLFEVNYEHKKSLTEKISQNTQAVLNLIATKLGLINTI